MDWGGVALGAGWPLASACWSHHGRVELARLMAGQGVHVIRDRFQTEKAPPMPASPSHVSKAETPSMVRVDTAHMKGGSAHI